MTNMDKNNFKQQLIHLRQQFFTHANKNAIKAVPLKQLVVMLQKYLHVRPTQLCSLLNRSLGSNMVTWDQFLQYMHQEIELRDQVNKLTYNKPSTIQIFYHRNPDHHLEQDISSITAQVKKKQTNIIKSMVCNYFIGFKMLSVILEKQIIFYDCDDKKIIRKLEFRYHNVKNKTLINQQISHSQMTYSNTEYFDKVAPISRRTDDFLFNQKIRKNTNNSEELKNGINRSMKKSKIESSMGSDSIRRSITDAGTISRSITRMGLNHRVSSKGGDKKPVARIRSNDNKTIFRIMTETSMQNGLQFMSAMKNSRQTFQKYIVVEKQKIQPQEQEIQKVHNDISIKRNFQSQIINMRQTTKELSLKRNLNRATPKSSLKYPSRRKTKRQDNQSISVLSSVKINDAYSCLEKKVLEIQSISIMDNYLLVSLMNRQVRLYRFKKTLAGFEDQLILEKQYDCIVSYVILYKSLRRNLYNFVAAKYVCEEQTKIYVYQLSETLQKYQQVFCTSVGYAPVFQTILPLGIAGFSQKGNMFVLELNSPVRKESQTKTIDTHLLDPDSGSRISISCLNLHQDQMNIYIGSKNGCIYIFDRFSESIRAKSAVGKYAINHIHFINQSVEIMFSQYPDKIGIANASTLNLSSVAPIDPKYLAIIPFFSNQDFLMYGTRKIGSLGLKQSYEKKFVIEKPMKILKRRQKIGKKVKSEGLQKATHQHKIAKYFIQDQHYLILLCSDGQIMVFDEQLSYTGSYFTLTYDSVNNCSVCYNHKYLSLLYENNQIQIVNIYTQQIVLNPPNPHQQIYELLFCHSAVYLCGYLTAITCRLVLFGFDGQILTKVKIDTVAGIQVKQKCCMVRFYKGSMILINTNSGEINFFMKKTCERKYCIKCWSTDLMGIYVVDLCMNKRNGILTLARSDNIVQAIQLNSKQIVKQWKLEKEGGKILSHKYDVDKQVLNVFWKTCEGQNVLSKYNVSGHNANGYKMMKEETVRWNKGGRRPERSLESLSISDVKYGKQDQCKAMQMIGQNVLMQNKNGQNFVVVAGPMKSSIIPLSNF